MLSQLQNSSARKIVLLEHLATAPSRRPSWAGRRRRGSGKLCLSSQDALKSSIFRYRGVLQLPLWKKYRLFLVLAGLFLIAKNFLYGSEFLTGNWNGSRQDAHEQGIDFFAAYANDLIGNPLGGKSHGFTNAGSLDTTLIIDLERIAKIKGCTLFNSLSWRSGSSLSYKKIDNQFPVQQLYGGETYKLVELYLQETLFKGHLNIKAGRLCAGNDFIASPLYLRYVTGAINSNPISVFYNAFFSTYPYATWGAYLDFRIRSFLFKFGVYNSNQKIWNNQYHGANITFESQQGVMWISECTYLFTPQSHRNRLEGNYTIGGYYITGKTAKFNTSQPSNNYGYYILFDQMLYRNKKPKNDERLTSWGSLVLAPPDRNPFPIFFAAGLVYQGLFTSRPHDALCLGAAYGHYSSDLHKSVLAAKRKTLARLYGNQSQCSETDIELNYWLQATSWLTLTPVLQYIITPSGKRSIPNALVAGIQVGIDL